MKTMTCEELGGACLHTFTADTFEEIVQLSMKHGMEMFQKGDREHLDAMEEMKELRKSPSDLQDWMDDKRELFESL